LYLAFRSVTTSVSLLRGEATAAFLTMETIVKELANTLLDRLPTISPESRLLIGICGVPASGKTSLARRIVAQINITHRSPERTGADEENSSEIAILISQDGWHLSRSVLDTFEDVKDAYERRGAAFTFDGVGYCAFIQSLRSPIHTASLGESQKTMNVYAPSFSHTLKDPVHNSVSIHPHHRIVIIEGLYTFLNTSPWDVAAHTLDERWYVKVDLAEARDRLIRRHVVTGVTKNLAEAEWRADNNDALNGSFIIANMLEPTRVIYSVQDLGMATQGSTE